MTEVPLALSARRPMTKAGAWAAYRGIGEGPAAASAALPQRERPQRNGGDAGGLRLRRRLRHRPQATANALLRQAYQRHDRRLRKVLHRQQSRPQQLAAVQEVGDNGVCPRNLSQPVFSTGGVKREGRLRIF